MVSPVVHVNPANGATLRVSVRKIAAYQTAAVVFAALILFVASLVVAAVAPILAIPRVNASVLRTAVVVFAVLILFVVSLAAVVAVARTVMMMARAFRVTVSNGYELRVELSRWVLMMGSILKGQFIV